MTDPGKPNQGRIPFFAGSHVSPADLKAYIDGEMTGTSRLPVRWHLAHCAECREETRWLQRLGEDMRDLERATPSPNLRRRIMASLPEGPPPADFPAPARSRQLVPRYALAGALCVAVVAAGAVTQQLTSHKSHAAPAQASITTPGARITTPAVAGPAKQVGSTVSVPTSVQSADPNSAIQDALSHSSDPINSAADKLFEERMKEEAARQREASAAGPQESPANGIQIEPVGGISQKLLLLVSDLPTGRTTVDAITHRLGGTVKAEVLKPSDAPHVGLGDGETHLTIRVPRDKAGDLLQQLARAGDLLRRVQPVHPAPVSPAIRPVPKHVVMVRVKTDRTEQHPITAPPRDATIAPVDPAVTISLSLRERK
jgi:predicted anti-sigma-YlaC factor YlaD